MTDSYLQVQFSFPSLTNAANPSQAFDLFKNSTRLPAAVALLAAIALFVGFTQLMIRPMRNISKVTNRAGEGDFSARVDAKYTNYDDMNSIVISSDLQEMARNVNDMIEKLENQEHDRNIFISSVAHDIRTPLTSINGFITAMLDGTIPVDKQDKYDACAAALTLCQPSVHESFSIVIMESWLCGRPVLVHEACPVTRNFASESNGGLYFGSYFEFEGCTDYLLSHADTASAMGQNGRKYVLENFDWDVIVQKYISFFSKLTGEQI